MIKVTIKDGTILLHESEWEEISLSETKNLQYAKAEEGDKDNAPIEGKRKLTITGK